MFHRICLRPQKLYQGLDSLLLLHCRFHKRSIANMTHNNYEACMIKSPRRNTRVAGHTLLFEGQAIEEGRPRRTTEGYGECSCGQRSGKLFSNQQRKEWHREHKRVQSAFS